MSRPQVFVYLDEETKETVKNVAHKINLREAELFRALAIPHVKQLESALSRGVDPRKLRKKIMERMD